MIITLLPAARPSRPSAKLQALHIPTSKISITIKYNHGIVMPSPIGTTVVKTPRSKSTTKGIVIIGVIPK